MSIIIHFSPTSSLLQSSTAPPVTTCSVQTENAMTMGRGLENDSSISVMSASDSSVVDVSTSNTDLYPEKEDPAVSIVHKPLGSCFGLPYQDHNYGAPPPPTPPNHSPHLSPTHVCPLVETETVSIVTTTLENEEINETSVTRCVCGYEHDDEYMICCDRCLVWQHVDCMGLDRSKIPETYLCEQCEPRKIDRQKAKLLQAKKKVALTEKLFFHVTSDESEDGGSNQNSESLSKSKSPKKRSITDRDPKNEQITLRKGRPHSKDFKERMEMKRSKFRKRAKSRTDSTCNAPDEEAQDAWKCSSDWPKEEHPCTDNLYSDEVQLMTSALRNQGDDSKLTKQLQTQLCKVVDTDEQKKLVAVSDLQRDQIIIEWKGQFLSATEFRLTHPLFKPRLFPFVLFYKLRSNEELCIDSAEYGNDARFVRRSCTPTAEVKHLVLKGSLHLYISPIKDMRKGEEITIPFDVDYKDSAQDLVCACNSESCLLLLQWKNESLDSSEKRRRKRLTHSTDDDSNHSLSSTTATSPTKSSKTSPVKMCSSPQKVLMPSDSLSEQSDMRTTSEEQETDEHKDKRKMTREERKLDAIMRAFDQMEKAEKRRQQALDRLAHQKSQNQRSDESCDKQEDFSSTTGKDEEKEPSSTVTENSTEEEKLTSFHSTKIKKGKKRRGSGTPNRRRTRTNSGGSDLFNTDEASVCDDSLQCLTSVACSETCDLLSFEATVAPSPQNVPASPVLPKTKRFLHHEWLQEKVESSASVSCPLSIHTEVSWSVLAATPTCYVRCTKDTPSTGISAAHLRRSSIAGSHVKQTSGQGSAKKRWLRQAMYDNEPWEAESVAMADAMNDDVSSPLHSACFSPHGHSGIFSLVVSPQDGVVTPLKKRRIMRNSLESSSSAEWTATSGGMSPDHSSSEPAIDSFGDASHVVEDLKVELSNEGSCTDKCVPAENGLSKHLLKSLRENWIKNEKKSRTLFNDNNSHLEESPEMSEINFCEKQMQEAESKSVADPQLHQGEILSECPENGINKSEKMCKDKVISLETFSVPSCASSVTEGVVEKDHCSFSSEKNIVCDNVTSEVKEGKDSVECSSNEKLHSSNHGAVNVNITAVPDCSTVKQPPVCEIPVKEIEPSCEPVKDKIPLTKASKSSLRSEASSSRSVDVVSVIVSSNAVSSVHVCGSPLHDGNEKYDCNVSNSGSSYAQVTDCSEKIAANDIAVSVNNFSTSDQSSPSLCSVSNDTAVFADVNFSDSHTVPAKTSDLMDCTVKDVSSGTNKEDASNNNTLVTCTTQKRKVSLSEYRQRKRDNHNNAQVFTDKKKNNNCVLKPVETTEIRCEKEIKLAALPMFKDIVTKITKAECAPPVKKKGSKSVEEGNKISNTQSLLGLQEKRENLTERLRREFGFDDVSDECKTHEIETDLQKTDTAALPKAPGLHTTPFLSLCTQLPPPPPPSLPLSSPNTSLQFSYSNISQPYTQKPSFLVSQMTATQYVPGQKAISSPTVFPVVHPLSAPAESMTQAGCTYSAAMHTTVSRPPQLTFLPADNQRFMLTQQPGPHSVYHSPFKPRAYK